jgi:putative transposase
MEIRLSGHSAYCTEYHVIWITKYRYHVLNPGVKAYLIKLLPKVMAELPGCEIVKFNIQPDHIHMVMIIPPKYAVSAAVGKMKGMTSSELRKKFSWMKLRYSRENIVWSPGYFVSTVGVERDKILKYVEYQGRQDSGQAKLEM